MWYNAFGDHPLPPPLSPDAEREMVNRARQGDEKAREALIEHNVRFVVSIARKYQSDRAELEDLVSIGVCGLIKAVDSFNPDKGYRLITYVGRCVVNEILMELRKLKRRGYPDSLDAILYEDEDGGGLRLEDLLGTEPDTVSQAVEMEADMALLRRSLDTLPEMQRQILSMHYGEENTTQSAIAEHLGLSQSYVSRVEKRAINNLRMEMERAV